MSQEIKHVRRVVLAIALPGVLAIIGAGAYRVGVKHGRQQILTMRADTNPATPIPPAPLPEPSVVPNPALVVDLPMRYDPEFVPQSGLLLGCNELVRYHPAVYTSAVAALRGRAPVFGLVTNDEEIEMGRRLLKDAGVSGDNFWFVKTPLDTVWVRDFGPMFVRQTDGSVTVIDTDYTNVDNTERWRDNDMPILIGNLMELDVNFIPVRIEGGNLLHNGDGLCVTTTAVMRRNAPRGYDAKRIGALFQNRYGFESWIYVKELVNEPTGHADMFITFLARNLALVAECDPVAYPEWAAAFDEAAELLSKHETSMGRIRVHRIPLPPPVGPNFRSYNNVIMFNGRILVPVYSNVDPALQDAALETYRRLMPAWRVVPINADSMVPNRGLLHCVTCHIPSYVDVENFKKIGIPSDPAHDSAGETPAL